MQHAIERNEGWARVAGLSANELVEALDVLASGTGVRAVVIEPPSGMEPCTAGQFARLLACELPLIVVLAGELSAGQADIAVAGDIRIGEESLTFPRPVNGLERLRLLLRNSPAALSALWQAERLDAATALETGLVGERCRPGEGLRSAARLAAVIARRGPIATRLAKEAVWRGLAMPLEQGLRFETDLTLILQTTKDRAEGVRAFLEKRPPAFTGA